MGSTETCNNLKYKNVIKDSDKTNTRKTSSIDGILLREDFYNQKGDDHWKLNESYGVADIVEKGDFEQQHISDHKPIWVDISIDDIKDYCSDERAKLRLSLFPQHLYF